MRRFFLVSYDISNDKRLRRMFRLLRGYGEHIQYSVFLCQLTDKDKAVLLERIKDTIHHKEDQVLLIPLGSAEKHKDAAPAKWQVIGTPVQLQDISCMIY